MTKMNAAKPKTTKRIFYVLGVACVVFILAALLGAAMPDPNFEGADGGVKQGAVEISGLKSGKHTLTRRFIPHGSDTPQSHAQSVGINTNTNIETKTISVEGKPIKFPAYDTLSSAPVGMHIQITDDVSPIDIKLSEDSALGALHAAGTGLGSFTDVEITHGEHTALVKTDWAGMFDMAFPLHLLDLDKPLKFALSGYDIMSDAQNFARLDVDIFWAPGGGGPTSDGVNDYTNLFCGSPTLSTCVGSKMQAQNEAMKTNYDTALMMMGEQLSAVMMQYTQMIGSFIDARTQMKTQRVHQTLKAEAVKDYHPSEQMCRFGSFMKSVADVNQNMAQTKQALNTTLMNAYTGVEFNSTSESVGADLEARLQQFREVYCDPSDNNNGLGGVCGTGGAEKSRFNKDIDFTRTVNFPMTLDIDLTNANKTNDEEDVIALATNLYWPSAMNHANAKGIAADPVKYMDLRQMLAMNNIAHNSYTNAIATKASGPSDSPDGGGGYMKAMMRDFGIADADIEKMLGAYPSYNAQMEVLTKKIYQTPHFFTNLYDKPANVKRIGVTLDAIKLMQMRDLHAASLRREMLNSALIEEALVEPMNKLNAVIKPAVSRRLAR